MIKHPAFVPEQVQERTDYPLGVILRRNKTAGDIGIEIECEGNKFQKDDRLLPKWWSYHQDNSLRGQDNAEYVLKNPIKFDDVETAIKDLYKMFEKYGTVLSDSNRTSTHIHLNMQNFHLNRLAAFLGLYFSVEELLTQWCGEHRVGNLFCLRGRDAPAIVTSVKKFIQSDCRYELSSNLHYAGLNANALSKFGSLEVRTFRGVSDPAVILQWVQMLRRIYELSAEFPDPRGVCDNFSGQGALAYLNFVLGDMSAVLINDLSWDNQQIMEKIYDGIHLAQDICYCRDWSVYNPVKVSEDPFGRVLMKPFSSANIGLAINDFVFSASDINTIGFGTVSPTTMHGAQPASMTEEEISEMEELEAMEAMNQWDEEENDE